MLYWETKVTMKIITITTTISTAAWVNVFMAAVHSKRGAEKSMNAPPVRPRRGPPTCLDLFIV